MSEQLEEKKLSDLILNSPESSEKYNELLREIESLKTIVLQLYTAINIQSEGVDRIGDNTIDIKEKIVDLTDELNEMKDAHISQTRLGYMKDYLLPLISMAGIAGVNYPVFWLLGPKAGLLASSVSYMMWMFK